MIVWVKYDLDNPDDEQKFKSAKQAEEMNLAIWDFQQDFLRSIWKYRELKTEEATELINEIYERFGQEFGKFE